MRTSLARLAALVVGTALAGTALGAAFPAVLRIPRRVPAAAAGLDRALFSHPAHASFGCYACHPAVFPQAPLAFTHVDMRDGRFCGACHDGRTAFAVEAAPCGRCHVAR